MSSNGNNTEKWEKWPSGEIFPFFFRHDCWEVYLPGRKRACIPIQASESLRQALRGTQSYHRKKRFGAREVDLWSETS